MSVIDPNKLLISSDFYSVQGEGISSGVPSYFVRLAICNLACGMSTKFLNKIKKDNNLEDGEIFVGDLHAEGKGHVGVFLAEAKREFPHIVRNAATFDEAVASLKTKNIISENVISELLLLSYHPQVFEAIRIAL